jgi:type IV pilus assembly protein PilM
MASNTVWGLDIGSSSIKAVKMQRSGTECSIVDFDIIDIPGGEDAGDRNARLQVAMKTLTENHKFGSDPVYLAIPTSICLHREFTLPPGAEAKLHELVQFEAKQQIPFPLDQVEWGYERYETGDDSKAINVTLIAVRKSDIQDLLAISESFNLRLAGIAAAPVALYNFIFFEFKPQQTTLILDAGARGTDFVVMNKRQIYFRSIQIAGREITRVLENKFKVPFDKAENLKKNIKQSPQMDQILNVIEPTLRTLGGDVQRTIGFYKAKSRGQKIQQCYLLGHTFRLPRMAEYLQTQIREAPFAIVEGLQRIRLGPQVNREVWENEFPTMAVAIGLGIQGLGLGELTLNLIPSEKESEVARSEWKKWAGAAAAVILLTLAASYVFASGAFTIYTAQSGSVNRTLDQVKQLRTQEENAAKPLPPRMELLKRLARLGRDRGKVQQVYNSILTLKGADGRTLFGLASHLHLTNLYASRSPLSRETKLGSPRNDKLADREVIKRLYAPLNAGPEPLSLPPEMRPDAPLLVVVSGEVEVVNNNKSGALDILRSLEESLKARPENKTHEVEHEISAEGTVTYEEHVPEYDTKGELKKPDPNAPAPNPGDAAAPNKFTFIPFHMLFLWEDPADKDLTPAPEKLAEKKP